MRMTIRDRLKALRRIYPFFDGPARFMWAVPADKRRSGRNVVAYLLLWSDDGRVSIHPTHFVKKRSMTVPEWGDWLYANAEEILGDTVLASVGRNDGHGSIWTLERIIGWHFTKAAPRKRSK